MTNDDDIFSNSADATKATGGLAAFGKLAQLNAKSGDTTTVWGRIWEARKGTWPFQLAKPGDSTTLVFLTGMVLMPAFELAHSKRKSKDGSPFAGTDYVRASCIGLDGEPTGKIDYIREVRGSDPRMIGVAIGLYAAPAGDKSGNKNIVGPVIIKSPTILETLAAYSAGLKTDLCRMMFNVKRTSGPKSDRAGDVWTTRETISEERLDKYDPTWKDRLATFDIDALVPELTPEEQIELLRIHVKVCGEFKDTGGSKSILAYNREAWERISGGSPAAATKTAESGGATERSEGTLDLNDLLDSI